MTEMEVSTSTELVLPHTSELIDLTSERQVALALSEIQELKGKLLHVERHLREVLAEKARLLGTKTFYVGGVGNVEVKGDTRTTWDAEKLEDRLRAAGAPEELIREIVVETFSYKVDARRASRAARANEAYAEAIEACREEEPVVPTVSIKASR